VGEGGCTGIEKIYSRPGDNTHVKRRKHSEDSPLTRESDTGSSWPQTYRVQWTSLWHIVDGEFEVRNETVKQQLVLESRLRDQTLERFGWTYRGEKMKWR
jgi:hypothetical protein